MKRKKEISANDSEQFDDPVSRSTFTSFGLCMVLDTQTNLDGVAYDLKLANNICVVMTRGRRNEREREKEL